MAERAKPLSIDFMPRCKDLKNKVFGKLTVLEKTNRPIDAKTKNRGIWWKCRCECGRDRVVLSTALTQGWTNHCGCIKKRGPFKGHGEIPKSVYTAIKNWSARSRNIEFNLSIEYLWDLFLFQERKCAYTGEELKFGTSKNDSSKTASLDRIDSNKGYVKGNVVWCHKKINVLKMDAELQDFLKMCKKITENEERSKAVISTVKQRDLT